MKTEIHIPYELLDDASNLPQDEQALLSLALEACNTSWSPYSGFQVGCAIFLADGELIKGSNQENMAFPSGLCAERTALFHAGSLGKGGMVLKLAIRAMNKKKPVEEPVTPCGACRQVMLEYEKMSGKPIIVLMQGERGKVLKINGIANALLPFTFDIQFD